MGASCSISIKNDNSHPVEQQVLNHREANHKGPLAQKQKQLPNNQCCCDDNTMQLSNDIPTAMLPAEPRKRNVSDVLKELLERTKGNKQQTTTNAPPLPKVLVRVDFNVPMNGEGQITDDSRIRGALATIRAIRRSKCHAILMSHMGRPKLVQKGEDKDGAQRKQLSLRPVATKLSELLEQPVIFGEDCLGEPAKKAVAQLENRTEPGIVLLENLRFYKQEEKNDANFCKQLASLADAYVNDAFGTCHRAHASVSGIPALLDPKLCGVGCLVSSEIAFLDFSSLQEGERVAAIIGGSKVSTKLPVIKGLMEQVDTLVLGGGLAFTFLKAQGIAIGNSLVEVGMIDIAKSLLEQAKNTGKTLVVPVDAVCSKTFPKQPMNKSETQTFDLEMGGGIEDGWMGLDVGPKTVALLEKTLSGSSKIVFNGPMGVFEVQPFDEGTRGLVDVLANLTEAGCVTVVGGGDSVAALEQFGRTKDVSYVSTGGGATLELLAGEMLPGVEAIGYVD